MKKVANAAVLLGIGIFASMVWAQSSQSANTNPPGSTGMGNQPATGSSGSSSGSDYVIGAEDSLHISVWKEPELTETLPVRPDGKISMPLLNDVQAAGLTPGQLAISITEKLKKYLADPRVTVVVTAMNSQRIFVTGEVNHSGPMPLLPHMTVLQAISEAGFTQFANPKAIYLLRTTNGRQEKIPFNYKQVVKGHHPEQNIQLKPGDTIVVP
ncbi:MAG TPA: polysaccharide biosynthesis/export family protein [Candidatus Sulfotelmatobacter sp.]|nr:polysaccharide biosynthesis/export family protein [Candidatus Sulfotelmatobacter sp.]